MTGSERWVTCGQPHLPHPASVGRASLLVPRLDLGFLDFGDWEDMRDGTDEMISLCFSVLPSFIFFPASLGRGGKDYSPLLKKLLVYVVVFQTSGPPSYLQHRQYLTWLHLYPAKFWIFTAFCSPCNQTCQVSAH